MGRFKWQRLPKSILRYFASPEIAEQLVLLLSQNPSINLYAVSCFGKELKAGVDEDGATAPISGKLIMNLFKIIFSSCYHLYSCFLLSANFFIHAPSTIQGVFDTSANSFGSICIFSLG
jgi:hypothetical protein